MRRRDDVGQFAVELAHGGEFVAGVVPGGLPHAAEVLGAAAGGALAQVHFQDIVGAAEAGFAAEGAGSPEALRLAVPQAADELLSINDVDASFVYYRLPNGQISYSARSLGIFNVQLVMEALGGGGHHTMAGAQIEAHSLEEAEVRLCRAIDEYYSRQTQQK